MKISCYIFTNYSNIISCIISEINLALVIHCLFQLLHYIDRGAYQALKSALRIITWNRNQKFLKQINFQIKYATNGEHKRCTYAKIFR